MRSFHWVLLCVLVLSSGSLLAEQPLFLDATGADNFKVYWLVRAKTPPRLDGKLDEAVWKRTPVIRDWGITNYGRQKGAVGKIEARFAWDQQYLYVAFTCWHDRNPDDMAELRRTALDTSKDIYGRECVELHIDGNLDHVTRFQVWFNPVGEKMIFWHYDFGWGLLVNQDYGLNADWDYVPLLTKDYWQVEGRIALSDIQVVPKVGTMFALNPCWFDWCDTREPLKPGAKAPPRWWQFVTWSTQGDSHHDVRLFGRLILVDDVPASLEKGLRLAFPDLDTKTVMVQTTDRFLTFRNGKMTAETFIDKARAEVAAARAQYDRLVKVAAECKRPNKWRDKTIADAGTELAKIEAGIKDAKSISIAKLNTIRAELGELNAKVDSLYWTTRQDLLLTKLPGS